MTNGSGSSAAPTTPLGDALKQTLRPRLIARGAPAERVDQWLNSAQSVGELAQWLIAWCRQQQGDN